MEKQVGTQVGNFDQKNKLENKLENIWNRIGE